MKYLKIRNSGKLDIRLVALMGGTTKANDQFKIGQFGTGLKYTLAYLFRNNLDFKIFVGEGRVKVHIETEIIKDTPFDIICINRRRTSITTQMGAEWKAWMIIRELWCNALDEGGYSKAVVTDNLTGEEGTTTFYIQINEDIQKVLDDWDRYFIPDLLCPIYQDNRVRLYPASEGLCIYKNGVLVYSNMEKSAVFRYDILDVAINELREYKSTMSLDISRALKQMDTTGIKYFLENISDDMYEGNNMDYDWGTTWGPAWQSFMMTNKLLNTRLENRFIGSGYHYSSTDYTRVPLCIYNSLTDCFDGMGITDDITVRKSTKGFYEIDAPDAAAKIDMCSRKLASIGYYLNEKMQFSFGFFDETSTNFAIDKRRGKLLVNMYVFHKTSFEIMSALVEYNELFCENVKEGGDIKKHFVNLYTAQLLTNGLTTPDELLNTELINEIGLANAA